MTKARRIVFSLISIGVGLILAGVAAELILRLLGTPTSDVYTVNATQFDEIPGIYEPRQSVIRTAKKELAHEVTINSLGYRGYDFPLEKPEGVMRILVAGDSFVFGEYVQDDETMPVRLEALLRDAGVNAQVVNAGLLGGTITGEASMIERGLVLQPDVAILVFHENDLENLVVPLWNSMERNRVAKGRFPMSVVYPLMRDTALWSFAMKIRGKLKTIEATKAAQDSQPGPDAGEASQATGELGERYHRELAGLRDLLRQRNVPLLYVIFPGHNSTEGRQKELAIVQWAVRLADDLGIPRLNLLDALRASPDPKGCYLLPFDGHPSAQGHAVAASAIAQRLIEMMAGAENPVPANSTP